MIKKLVEFGFSYLKFYEKEHQNRSQDSGSLQQINISSNNQVESSSLDLTQMVENHGHFYTCIQSIIMMIVYRQNDIFNQQNIQFYLSLNLNIILLDNKLNPLLYCTDNLLNKFNNLLLNFNLPNISAKLSDIQKIRETEFLSNNSNLLGNLHSSKANHWNPLDFYDIFEPSFFHLYEQTFSQFRENFREFIDVIKIKNELMNDSFVKDEKQEFKSKKEEKCEKREKRESKIEKNSSESPSDSEDSEPKAKSRRKIKREKSVSESSSSESSQSEPGLDSDSSDLYDPNSIPVMQRILKRERKISERLT